MSPDRINFIHSGSVFNVSVELLEELLANNGMGLHSAVPLQVIDKVGFLKVGDDAKEIVADLLSQYMQSVGFDTDESQVSNANWPFPTSGTDAQGTLDLDENGSLNIDVNDIDIDLGSVYWSEKTIKWPADVKWSVSLPDNDEYMNSETFTITFNLDDDDVTSQYCLAMNADRA